jgi:hypothetical protein
MASVNHSTEPNEPDGAPEPELDARPDLETMPLTDASTEVTPPLGVEEVPWGGPDLVETVYAPLTEQYEHLQTRLQDDAVGWTAQIGALHALRTARVAGDWETLARLLVAPGTLEETDAVRLVRTANEPETVRSLIADLKAAGERTLLLAPNPEKAAELAEAVQDAPEILALLIETRPPGPPAAPDVPLAPPAASDETLKLPALPDENPAATTSPEPPQAQEEASAVPERSDFGSHGTVEFKPVTGLPDPGAGAAQATRAEPLPGGATPEEDHPHPGPAQRDAAGPGPADATRAELLPGRIGDDLQPGAATPASPVETSVEATAAHVLPGRAGDDAEGPSGESPPDSTETEALPVQAGDDGPGMVPLDRPENGSGAGAENASATSVEAAQAAIGAADEPQHGALLEHEAEPGPATAGSPAAEATQVDALPAGATDDVPSGNATEHPGGEAGARAGDAVEGAPIALPEEDHGGVGGVSDALLSGGAPETWVMGAALRPVGEGWPRAWRAEAGVLRRGLMLLEQWPRDAEALGAVRAQVTARKEALDAELAALASAIEEARDAAQSAEGRAAEAEAEAQRLVAVQREAEGELAGPRAEAERLQAIADAAAAEASELTRVADEAFARCTQLDERARNAQEEFRGAQQVEASLKDELARAQAALPAAAEEADRLAAVDADASAEGHAAYYRLVSAESALAAIRRKMTLTQRLHVATPPSDLKSVRAEVRARTRDADEAAKRAQEAKEAAERAEAHRQGLAAFVAEGGPRLATAREAQERLTTELAWLATERETAGAEHQEQARRAAESVDRATQAGLEARAAYQAARVIEERVEAARAGHEEAVAAMARARADAEAAMARAAEARAELDRRSAEGEAEAAAGEAELRAAVETEARARANVREVFGADPADDPDVIGERRRSAMARIEELGRLLEGGEVDGAALLPGADLVVGTPVGVGAAVPGERFGALVAVGAVDDADFLVGAVRTGHWILVGSPEDEEPGHGTFARCAVAAPRLLEDGR